MCRIEHFQPSPCNHSAAEKPQTNVNHASLLNQTLRPQSQFRPFSDEILKLSIKENFKVKLLFVACHNFFFNRNAFLQWASVNKNESQPPQSEGKHKTLALSPLFWKTPCAYFLAHRTPVYSWPWYLWGSQAHGQQTYWRERTWKT